MIDIYQKRPKEVVDGIPVFLDTAEPYVQNYDRIAADHLEALRKTKRSPFMTENQITESNRDTIDVIKNYVSPGSRILDAGVGYGLLLSQLEGYDRYGVDVATPYLTLAKKNGIDVSLAKLEDLPYSDALFQTVITCDVLEHVFRLDDVILELIRVLVPGGHLVVRVPNEESLDGYLTAQQPYAHSHVRGFSLTSLRLLLEKCFGLMFVEHKYTGNYFAISSQLKYGLIRKDNPLFEILRVLQVENPSLKDNSYIKSISNMTRVTVEEMVDTVMGLRETLPSVYEAVSPHLVTPTEVIAVFQKGAEGHG